MNTKLRQQQKLINKAKEIYSDIYPLTGKKDFSECFTEYNNKLFFWFDTEDRSTHLISEEVLLDEKAWIK